MGLIVKRAVSEDSGAMTCLIEKSGLSTCDILAANTIYWTCRSEDDLVGVCGLELGDGCVLLRSVCVRDGDRGRGLAERLVNSALAEAARLGLGDVYLFSKDSGGYFERLGWNEVPVAEVVARLPSAPQVRRYEQTGWYPNERAFRRSATTE